MPSKREIDYDFFVNLIRYSFMAAMGIAILALTETETNPEAQLPLHHPLIHHQIPLLYFKPVLVSMPLEIQSIDLL